MPTEDNLRAALTALERHAPDADRVMPGARRHSRRGLRPPRAIAWGAGIAAAAALAGVVTAVSLPGGTPATNQMSKAALEAKVLAAISAANDVVYIRSTFQTIGVPHTSSAPSTGEDWTYPWQASPGQRVRTRSISSYPGFFNTDSGVSYLMPAQVQTSPAPGTFTVTAQKISVDYVSKTWYEAKNSRMTIDPAGNPTLIASYFKSTQWTERNTTLNGQAAIELTLKERVLQGQSTVNSWTEYLWVDASTYLPLYNTETFGPPGQQTHGTTAYQYLPATPANLAKLTPPVPAGFRQVSPPVVKAYAPVPCSTRKATGSGKATEPFCVATADPTAR
jgi:hypothetical protein